MLRKSSFHLLFLLPTSSFGRGKLFWSMLGEPPCQSAFTSSTVFSKRFSVNRGPDFGYQTVARRRTFPFDNRTVNDECTTCVSYETRCGMWHSRGDRCAVQQKDQQKRAILPGNERAMPVCTDAEFEQNVHAKGCSTRTGESRRPRASSIPTSCVPASFIRDAGTKGPTRGRVRDYPNVGS